MKCDVHEDFAKFLLEKTESKLRTERDESISKVIKEFIIDAILL